MPDNDTGIEKLLAALVGWAIGYLFGLLYVTNVLEPLNGGVMK